VRLCVCRVSIHPLGQEENKISILGANAFLRRLRKQGQNEKKLSGWPWACAVLLKAGGSVGASVFALHIDTNNSMTQHELRQSDNPDMGLSSSLNENNNATSCTGHTNRAVLPHGSRSQTGTGTLEGLYFADLYNGGHQSDPHDRNHPCNQPGLPLKGQTPNSGHGHVFQGLSPQVGRLFVGRCRTTDSGATVAIDMIPATQPLMSVLWT